MIYDHVFYACIIDGAKVRKLALPWDEFVHLVEAMRGPGNGWDTNKPIDYKYKAIDLTKSYPEVIGQLVTGLYNMLADGSFNEPIATMFAEHAIADTWEEGVDVFSIISSDHAELVAYRLNAGFDMEGN